MPEEKHFYQEIKEAVKELEVAQEDGTITLVEAGRIAYEIGEAAVHLFQAMGDDAASHFDQLVEDCELLFDEYIEPWNIPYVPKLAERFLDQAVKGQIRNILGIARDAIQNATDDGGDDE